MTKDKAEFHHLVGTSIEPGGIAKGCAHSDSEYRNYVDFGTLPNPSCPAIERWNANERDAHLESMIERARQKRAAAPPEAAIIPRRNN
jgi:hypothetical protein